MELHDLKVQLQDHFKDGLLIVVGSGLSIAEGIPGMTSLAKHLLAEVPRRITAASKDNWSQAAKSLEDGNDLESVLLANQPDPALESVIVELTTELILPRELEVFESVIRGDKTLRFTRIIEHVLKPNTGIPIVTTNYDRLIELAIESSGLSVDGLFVGHHVGQFDEKASQYSLCRSVVQHRKTVRLKYCEHAIVLKPHGSLDWFIQNGVPRRCPFSLNLPRLLITPGLNKYRGGYSPPFDSHRERANREIDRAARFLVVGYGFNDDHLQTHLEPRLRDGLPTLILTYELTERARALATECPAVTALSRRSDRDGVIVTTSTGEFSFEGDNLWDLGVFSEKVF